MSAALKPSDDTVTEPELTDGFHLVIDALKLNGIKTIYRVPGIPIHDLGRKAQAAGVRGIPSRRCSPVSCTERNGRGAIRSGSALAAGLPLCPRPVVP